jgi:hypothetical protein
MDFVLQIKSKVLDPTVEKELHTVMLTAEVIDFNG